MVLKHFKTRTGKAARVLSRIWPICLMVLFTSCFSAKFIPEDRVLHVKNSLSLKDDKQVDKPSVLESELSNLMRPNLKYGMGKWRLGLNARIKKVKKEKGFKNWLKNKLGTGPVYFSLQRIENSRLQMDNYLLGEGYFKAEILADTSIKKQQAKVHYTVFPGLPYRLREIYFPKDSSLLVKALSPSYPNSYLQKSDRYQTENILAERERLAKIAVDSGFLEVRNNDFIVFLDTLPDRPLVDIYIRIKARQDSLEHARYQLGQTRIYQNYNLNQSDSTLFADTILYDGLQIIQDEEVLRPKALARSILQREGDMASDKLTGFTIARLQDLGVYKFVNVQYQQGIDSTSYSADRNIYLRPDNFRDISAEIKANTRTGNFLGTGLEITYQDRNIFNGAERFSFSISGDVETQLGNRIALINTAKIGARFNLLLPYFFPFKNWSFNKLYTPKTDLGLSANFEKRTEFYTISSITFQYGYVWRQSVRKQHRLYPIILNRINLLDRTEALDSILNENPRLRASFDSVYISGIQYIYTVSNRRTQDGNNYYFFNVNAEASGNINWLIARTLNRDKELPYKILDLPFAQYLKLDVDLRYYFSINSSTFVTRFFAGAGISYGNLKVMPYVKQYFSGGSNGIRAFPIRTLGPGSYFNPDLDPGKREFIDQTGDIKLEGNLEYRFDVWSYLKGAFFIDAGNIWLLRDEDDTRSGGVFKFNKFYQEIAVGTGLGLRLAISSFIIRLDAAFPLRKPYLPENERWVIKDIDFFNPSWRRDNLVWNLALGYPF